MPSFSMNVVMDYEEDTETVTIRSRKYGTLLAKFKLESSAVGTFTRIREDEDCDNYWIGVKPADSVVFEEGLFYPRRHLIVDEIKFRLEGNEPKKREG